MRPCINRTASSIPRAGERTMKAAAEKLRAFRKRVAEIGKTAGTARAHESNGSRALEEAFTAHMNNDLRVGEAFDGMQDVLQSAGPCMLTPPRAAGMLRTLRQVDAVLQVIF